jgi:ArsR family metal-binding transcriptional regulator
MLVWRRLRRRVSDGGTFGDRASRLARALPGARYVNRERAILVSKRQADRFVELYAAGYDGSSFSRAIILPKAVENA